MTEADAKTAAIGRTGLMVTKLGFGAAGLGDMPDTYGYRVNEEQAKATVRAIFEGPANYIDTSRIYGMGRSEERIGAAIRERGGLPRASSSRPSSTAIQRPMFSTPCRPAARSSRASPPWGWSGST